MSSNPLKAALERELEEARRAYETHWAPEAVAAREAAESAARAKRDAAHVAEWRRNLRTAAPIRDWEDAWAPADWHAVQVVREWLAGGCARHLFLFGGRGVGKTTAAAYAVRHWVEPGKADTVAWLRPNEVVSAVCHSYDPTAPRLGRRVVIDDIGMERQEDFEHALAVLLERQNVTVIATTNLTGAEWRARYTDVRLLSRLNHHAVAMVIKGGNRRREDGGF